MTIAECFNSNSPNNNFPSRNTYLLHFSKSRSKISAVACSALVLCFSLGGTLNLCASFSRCVEGEESEFVEQEIAESQANRRGSRSKKTKRKAFGTCRHASSILQFACSILMNQNDDPVTSRFLCRACGISRTGYASSIVIAIAITLRFHFIVVWQRRQVNAYEAAFCASRHLAEHSLS